MVRDSIPVYGPQSLQVSVGFGPEKEDMHYTSPVYPVDNSAGTTSFCHTVVKLQS
jgi:hypothetical protein